MKGIEVEFATRAEAQAALPHLRAMLRAVTEVVEPVHYDDGSCFPGPPSSTAWIASAYVVTRAEHIEAISGGGK